MKAYIGASINVKDTAAQVAEVFREHGISVESQWHNSDTPTDAKPLQVARQDWYDLSAEADTFVFLNIAESTGGGCLTELGMAISEGKKVIIIGDHYNAERSPFITLADKRFEDVADFLEDYEKSKTQPFIDFMKENKGTKDSASDIREA